MGGFSFFVLLNPWASIVKFWIVFCLGKDFLFKSILAGCGAVPETEVMLGYQNVDFEICDCNVVLSQFACVVVEGLATFVF